MCNLQFQGWQHHGSTLPPTPVQLPDPLHRANMTRLWARKTHPRPVYHHTRQQLLQDLRANIARHTRGMASCGVTAGERAVCCRVKAVTQCSASASCNATFSSLHSSTPTCHSRCLRLCCMRTRTSHLGNQCRASQPKHVRRRCVANSCIAHVEVEQCNVCTRKTKVSLITRIACSLFAYESHCGNQPRSC